MLQFAFRTAYASTRIEATMAGGAVSRGHHASDTPLVAGLGCLTLHSRRPKRMQQDLSGGAACVRCISTHRAAHSANAVVDTKRAILRQNALTKCNRLCARKKARASASRLVY
jgi:hypothetical protein